MTARRARHAGHCGGRVARASEVPGLQPEFPCEFRRGRRRGDVMARRADVGCATVSAALVLLRGGRVRCFRLIGVLARVSIAGCASAAGKPSPEVAGPPTPLTPSQSRIVTTALKYVRRSEER